MRSSLTPPFMAGLVGMVVSVLAEKTLDIDMFSQGARDCDFHQAYLRYEGIKEYQCCRSPKGHGINVRSVRISGLMALPQQQEVLSTYWDNPDDVGNCLPASECGTFYPAPYLGITCGNCEKAGQKITGALWHSAFTPNKQKTRAKRPGLAAADPSEAGLIDWATGTEHLFNMGDGVPENIREELTKAVINGTDYKDLDSSLKGYETLIFKEE